jgi:hypothetical protein
MNRVCPNVRHENITFVVVQMAIEIYSLPISTANGIKFRFQFYQNVRQRLEICLFILSTDTFLHVICNRNSST